MSISSLTAGPALAAHLNIVEHIEKAKDSPDPKAEAVLFLAREETAALTDDVLGKTAPGSGFVDGYAYEVVDASGGDIKFEMPQAPISKPMTADQKAEFEAYQADGGFTLKGIFDASFFYDPDTETYTIRIRPQEGLVLEEPTEVNGVTVPKEALAQALRGEMTNNAYGTLLSSLGLNVPPAGGPGPDIVTMRSLADRAVDTPQPLLSAEERAGLVGYCEMLVDQALESELTPETAPILFNADGALIPERKTLLAREYMEGLTEACETNVLAYSLKPAAEGGASVMVIEGLGDDAPLDETDRRIIADLKACVGDVGTEYGTAGTKAGVLPDAIRQKVATRLLDGCEYRYEKSLKIADLIERRKAAEAESRAIDARIRARTDAIIAGFKEENSI